jgi:hypothetical protein
LPARQSAADSKCGVELIVSRKRIDFQSVVGKGAGGGVGTEVAFMKWKSSNRRWVYIRWTEVCGHYADLYIICASGRVVIRGRRHKSK